MDAPNTTQYSCATDTSRSESEGRLKVGASDKKAKRKILGKVIKKHKK